MAAASIRRVCALRHRLGGVGVVQNVGGSGWVQQRGYCVNVGGWTVSSGVSSGGLRGFEDRRWTRSFCGVRPPPPPPPPFLPSTGTQDRGLSYCEALYLGKDVEYAEALTLQKELQAQKKVG